MKNLSYVIVLSGLAATLVGCGGGGGGMSSPPPANSYGWVLIENSIPFFIVDTSIDLYGEAFSDNPTQYTPTNCPIGADNSMTVTWANKTANTSGYGYLGYWLAYGIFGQPECQHRWSANVPVAVGTNNIAVTVTGSTMFGSSPILITACRCRPC